MSINVVSFSSSGGAGNVARTLVDGFAKIGLDSKLVVASSSNLHSAPLANPQLTARAATDEYILKSKGWPSLISLARDRSSVLEDPLPEADLTIFRWMNGLLGRGFMRENQNLGKVVWSLDDMNPFTGVCHHSGSCDGFTSNCDNCPALRKPFQGMAASNLNRKLHFSVAYDLSYTAPSDWMHSQFKKSKLGQSRESMKILNPIQDLFFESNECSVNNQLLQVLIISANLDDSTKGVWDVADVLDKLVNDQRFSLTMIGRASIRLKAKLSGARFLGQCSSSEVLEQIRHSDVLLVPSRFETAGMVIAEAASQGIPAIVRNVGGMPEMTNYGENGYLFESNEDLSDILGSVSKKDLREKGESGKEWSQRLRPELIAAEFAEAFL